VIAGSDGDRISYLRSERARKQEQDGHYFVLQETPLSQAYFQLSQSPGNHGERR